MSKAIEQMTSVINAIHYLKKAKEAFQDWERQYKGKTKDMSIEYQRRIQWIYNDLISARNMRKDVIEVMSDEWNSDVYEIDDIAEMSKLLPSDQRAVIIEILKAILQGEKITFKEDGKN